VVAWVERARLTTDAVRQILLKRAATAGLKGTLAEPFSPHGLRAGFITTAYRNGVPDEEIMGHTRHRSLTTVAYRIVLNVAVGRRSKVLTFLPCLVATCPPALIPNTLGPI
jgi:integrase